MSLTFSELQLAIADVGRGVASVPLWLMMGWQEIKHRYRRSMLGPFWLTISTGALLAGMGPLYGRLLQHDISSYFPYLASSFIAWFFIANLITESCFSFISAEGYVKQTDLPLTVHVLRMLWKNLIIFAHNMVVVVIVLLIFPPPMSAYIWLFPLGLALILANGLWWGILLGLLCARFRHVPQVVISLVQIAMFLTPVLWKAEMLGSNQFVATWNPLFHFLEIVRGPLLGTGPSAASWIVVGTITLVGYVSTLFVFGRFRNRIAYWV